MSKLSNKELTEKYQPLVEASGIFTAEEVLEVINHGMDADGIDGFVFIKTEFDFVEE